MAKNNKTRFFYVLYSDKTRVFDQSERAYYPVYIINIYIYIYIGWRIKDDASILCDSEFRA